VLFPTIEFGLFLPVVFLGSWLLRPHRVPWRLFMLAASYVFYGWWRWDDFHGKYCFLLAGLTVGNHLLVQVLVRATDPRLRRGLVALGVVGNLGVLAWFKYTEWLAGQFNTWFGSQFDVGNIILPIGVSFLVFQSIGYVIDMGRRSYEPAPLLDFAVYLSFFPHVISGPLVRVSEFVPQIQRPADPRGIDSARAFRLIAVGFLKKAVVVNYLSHAVVAPVFDNPGAYGAIDNALAVYGYALLLFADFSGYTDIAIGVALLLGIEFPQNFDSPYRSLSIREFWRRWHMSLSRWLRDYLYIGLGGNRRGEGRTYVNLFLTMLLGGIWHGAAWAFVIWGALHGIALAVERRIVEYWGGGEPTRIGAIGRWLVTFHVVCLGWVFFNAGILETNGRASDGVGLALDVLGRIATGWAEPSQLLTLGLGVALVGLIALQFVPSRVTDTLTLRFSGWPLAAQAVALAAVFFVCDAAGDVSEFIYAQF
jgi:D-alanyl-lipoteichoic acid acyltransferase DltB (MBOAT superfamily)